MTIKASYDPGQTNVDFFCRNATAQWWNGSAFEAYNAANIATYRIAATESPASSGLYEATEPTGTVEFELRVRAATLADSYIVAGPATINTDIADIKAKTDLLGTGTVMLSAPVSGDGELLELILDTDYLAANGRALEWTFDQIPNITTAATGKFGLKNSENGTEVYINSSGAVTDLGGGTFKVSFDIANTALAGLSPEEYDWSVEVLEGSYKITIARNRQRKTRVNIVEKQT